MTARPDIFADLGGLVAEWDDAAQAGRFDGDEYETPEQEADDAVCDAYAQCAADLRRVLASAGFGPGRKCVFCGEMVRGDLGEYIDAGGSAYCEEHIEDCGACEDGEPHPHAVQDAPIS